jgi:hypothetical protein
LKDLGFFRLRKYEVVILECSEEREKRERHIQSRGIDAYLSYKIEHNLDTSIHCN